MSLVFFFFQARPLTYCKDSLFLLYLCYMLYMHIYIYIYIYILTVTIYFRYFLMVILNFFLNKLIAADIFLQICIYIKVAILQIKVALLNNFLKKKKKQQQYFQHKLLVLKKSSLFNGLKFFATLYIKWC
jgi:hypothetical protein